MLIAVIPARAGSKRIPLKNVVPLLGRPLISYAIQAILNSKSFDRVFVATDCHEIAETSRQCGAEVPFLRAKYNDDISPVSSATISFIKELLDQRIIEVPDIVAQVFACCPLISPFDINASVSRFISNKLQVSCANYFSGNPCWGFTLRNGSTSNPIWLSKEALGMRSQDLPEVLFPTGAVWIGRWEKLLEVNSFYSSITNFDKLPIECGIDIDWPQDLEVAEALLFSRIIRDNYDLSLNEVLNALRDSPLLRN
jgi:CMP-N-acetylneuraminic acid synthetase